MIFPDTLTFLMKHKSDTTPSIQNLISFVSTQFSVKLNTIKSDDITWNFNAYLLFYRNHS